jgi:hypothetical protein
VLTNGMKATFDNEYPVADFRDLTVSMEFPARKEDYPSIWVGWSPSGSVQTAGVGHKEYGDPTGGDGPEVEFRRWRFSGTATFTIVALTSLERDRLADEVIKVLAFGGESIDGREDFRGYLESNEFIGMNADFDQIEQQGVAETPGTPWGTDEVIYEITLGLRCLGEFVSAGQGDLVPLSAINVIPYVTTDPTSEGGWQ